MQAAPKHTGRRKSGSTGFGSPSGGFSPLCGPAPILFSREIFSTGMTRPASGACEIGSARFEFEVGVGVGVPEMWLAEGLGPDSTWLCGTLTGVGVLGVEVCDEPMLDPILDPDDMLGDGLGADAGGGLLGAALGDADGELGGGLLEVVS